MRIRTQLSLIAAAVFLPVVLVAAIAVDKIREGERQAALRGLKETVLATSLLVDREAQSAFSGLKALGSSPHLETGNFQAFYAQAQALNRPPHVWTLLLDSSGAQILNTAVPFGTPMPPTVALARVSEAIATQAPYVSDVIEGAVTHKQLVTIYVPASALGGRKFVVAQSFALEHWRNTALQGRLPNDWIVAVIDKNGRFISRSHKADQLVGQPARPELVAAAARSDEGLIRHNTLENVESYDAFSHSALTGWTIAVAAPVASIEAPANRAVRDALLGALMALAAAALAVAAFSRHLVRAFRNAQAAATALGRGVHPVTLKSSINEVNSFNEALNMAGMRLDQERRSRQEAQEERLQLLQEARMARQAAEAQNVAKDQFLAMLGHELRNPLAAISGATRVLEMADLDAARLERCTRIISRQNLHLKHIVDDLLDVSRLMAGKLELSLAPLDLAASVDNCVEALKLNAVAHKDRLTVKSTPVWILGDAVRIEQILNNLIGNALKFSPPGTPVQVHLAQAPGRATVTVRDRGMGMQPELLARIFDPFVQGPGPADSLQNGLGIGLALVRQLVELHHGEVTAASSGAGQGSVFTFWVPSIAHTPSPERSVPAPALRGRKIVYVEDNTDARTVMAELLGAFGFEVIQAVDGHSALATVTLAQPDVVLMDVGLPDLNGFEVARRLKANPATCAIPLVALTGYGQAHDKEQASLAGFAGHFVKPADVHEIVQAIEELAATPPLLPAAS